MLEEKFPQIVRDFSRSAISESIDHCKSRPDLQHYVPGLLRELAATYTTEADLIEENELSDRQERELVTWHSRATSVIGLPSS